MKKEAKGDDTASNVSEELTGDIDMFLSETPPEDVAEATEVEEEEIEEEESEDEEEESGDESEDESEDEESEDDEEDSEDEEGELDIDSIPLEDRANYLDQLYTSLDDESRKKWLSGQKGRIGKDVGKFRKETRIAHDERDSIKAKYDDLLVKSKSAGDNPFSALTTEDSIAEKTKQVETDLEAISKWLQSDEDYLDIGEKSYSAREVAMWPSAYGKQLKQLEAQGGKVKEITSALEKAKDVEVELEAEYKWLSDEDSAQYVEYQKLKSDPNWSKVLDFVPELAAELPKVLARYVSDSQPKAKKGKKALPIRGTRKPMGELGNAGMSTGKSTNKDKKLLKGATQRLFNGTASQNDLQAMFQ